MVVATRTIPRFDLERLLDDLVSVFTVNPATLNDVVFQEVNRVSFSDIDLCPAPSVTGLVHVPIAEQRAEWTTDRRTLVCNIEEINAGQTLEGINVLNLFVDHQVYGAKIDQLVRQHIQLDEDSGPRAIRVILLLVVVSVVVY